MLNSFILIRYRTLIVVKSKVVVENDEVATQLIKEGNLQECDKFIPLNMIQTYKISSERLKRIQNIAPGKVNLAKTLIKYDKNVETTMEDKPKTHKRQQTSTTKSRQLDLKVNEIIHKVENIKSRIVECDEIIENHNKPL
ncbi:hypothetical protein C1645_837973 [Glomus cerebriforme]|uniref:Uncharacterized protein n=1 Tax=Glomus cerebriforme TaxID=658196 RepID=A0A397S4A9_9GLOM|nr:hypothetical protein C1645_837973 [Glomus cerebriforme]